MVRKTKEEALETRNQLLDAAEIVFHREGYARTTLEAVAEAAKMTRGAIYWHFKNKSDLFNAMCERVRLPMEELVAAGVNASVADPLGHLRKVCVFFLQEASQNIHLRKVFDILLHKCEYVDPADPVYIRQHEAFQRGRERLEKLLTQAVEKGQLAEDLDIRLATIMFHSSIEGILKNWLFLPEHFNLADEAERLVDVCIGMITYAPGLRKGGGKACPASLSATKA